MNVTSILSGMTADLSGVEVLSNDTETILRDVQNVMSGVDIGLMQQVVTTPEHI